MTREQLSADIAAYHDMVYRLAFSCTGNRFDADDITQDAFMRLYMYKKSFSDDEHKKAFLIRVTTNLFKDMRKSAWFRKRTELDESIPAKDGIGDENKEIESTLCDYILELKPNYRAVIYLHYYEGYTTAEIAKILKIPESTVTTRLSRAREKLKTQINGNREVFCL